MTSSLVLSVNGKDYTVPSPPARIGLALQASYVIGQARRRQEVPPPYAVERAVRYDDMEHSLDEDALGPAWDQMVEDDVPLDDLRLAAQAAYVWIVTGSEAAALALMGEESTEGQADPKASTSTDAAATTRKRASTSGTTSRKKKSSD